MGPMATNGVKKRIKEDNPRALKRKRYDEDLEDLQRRVDDLVSLSPPPSTFSALPLSSETSSGLSACAFTNLTEVQSRALPLALLGRDLLCAAKTGSGKTLAFLVPVLENLYRQRWTELDGLGALIISPTRELAIQIYDVLQKVGRYHSFSAGLVVGGKSLEDERRRLGRMNILVCTPGRMLQHLDQTASLNVDDLRMLVLDEADRILDMGFAGTIDAILAHLPPERQTLLFSATQTKRIADLARLSLQEPEYVSVHEAAASATPSSLKQHYVVTPLPQKLDTLYSFIRSNLKSKIIVFLSSGKQVRFVYESFRRLQPGIPLLHLLGKQKQGARLDITTRFRQAKHSCLFATDVVARGLDFPSVDWVLQLDCPEDAETYIHRVGRTARYEKDGRAVLFLDPSEEEGMLARLSHKKVPIEIIRVREKKQQSIRNQLQNMCFKEPELKYLGQKAFVSYTRSVHLQKDKTVFNLAKLQLDEYATSLGLPGQPRIKFAIITEENRDENDLKKAKNRSRAEDRQDFSSDDDDGDIEDGKANGAKKSKKEVRTKYDRMFERRNQDILTEHYSKLSGNSGAPKDDNNAGLSDADSDDSFMRVKRPSSPVLPAKPSAPPLPSVAVESKRRTKLVKSKKAIASARLNAHSSKKVIFDPDTGEGREIYAFRKEGDWVDDWAKDGADWKEREREKVAREDREVDKLKEKERVEGRKRRRKERRAREEIDDDEEDEGQRLGRERKWFEDEEGVEWERGVKRRRGEAREEEPRTLQDLEALAEGLIAG